MTDATILAINTGSSSLKLGVYAQAGEEERLVCDLLVDGVGRGQGKMELRDEHGNLVRSEATAPVDQQEALRAGLSWLETIQPGTPVAIGHRVVHGGPRLVAHQRVTPEAVEELRRSVHFAPLHIPMALALIEEAERRFPEVPQFMCLDTAFHQTIPEAGARFALPRRYFDEGIRRYGFHGLSYESVVRQMGSSLPERVVMAHLGSGASVAAIKAGRSVDTSMGLTPTGGIPMATRCGDLDPGVLLYLLRSGKMSVDDLEKMLNHESGLKAISDGVADMRELEARADRGDGKAAMAIEMFCNAISKTVASYAAVLGGMDLLIFTGGIGEHSERMRGEVCERLAFLGVVTEPSGKAGAKVSGREVGVRVVSSQEDMQIALHCRTLMQKA